MDWWEWIVVAGVFIALLFWGGHKIPDLARAIGRAKREFDAAYRQLTNPIAAPASGPSSGAPWTSASASPETSSDDVLIATAKKLGITTEGKTREEMSNEILQTANASKLPPALLPISKKKNRRGSHRKTRQIAT
jgi:sec-independent protein translocase protein TatA